MHQSASVHLSKFRSISIIISYTIFKAADKLNALTHATSEANPPPHDRHLANLLLIYSPFLSVIVPRFPRDCGHVIIWYGHKPQISCKKKQTTLIERRQKKREEKK